MLINIQKNRDSNSQALLTAMKHETAAMIMVIAAKLTSSKMAAKRISWRSQIVEAQRLSPS
ncbi:hypothetical protein GBA52_027532 [Prunus armeniaca]|nr:hypothetical protein GBA52_027532 [Prunus armeniaca]